MATLPVQSLAVDGLEASFSAIGAGDEFVNDGDTFIYLKNGSIGGITITIETTKLIDGDLTVEDRAVSVSNGSAKLIGPLDKDLYNDANGKVQLTYAVVGGGNVIAIISAPPVS